MAVYKVPQDVEAEDKLLGPFSFRQFIYLIVAALGSAVGFGLWQIFPGLIIIPLPFVLLFLILALPLKKDQPMETYLVAVIRYFLKPRRRMWQPEGSIGLVTVTAAPSLDLNLTKGIGGSDAAQQLNYLSQVLDTQGWSTRGVKNSSISMIDTVYEEAQTAEDVLDDNANVARTFDSMLDHSNVQRRRSMTERLQQVISSESKEEKTKTALQTSDEKLAAPITETASPAVTAPVTTPFHVIAADDSTDEDVLPKLDYNPYPINMNQHVIRPLEEVAPAPIRPTPATSAKVASEPKPIPAPIAIEEAIPEPVSPDIIRLASNNDLSISALQHEAQRLHSHEDGEEVVISLR